MVNQSIDASMAPVFFKHDTTRRQTNTHKLSCALTSLEKYLALTTSGTEGSFPFPSTLKKPCWSDRCGG